MAERVWTPLSLAANRRRSLLSYSNFSASVDWKASPVIRAPTASYPLYVETFSYFWLTDNINKS